MTSRWLQVAVAILLGWCILAPSTALAGKRKRVVVLEFDGPKAEKFHKDVIKVIKKRHTVVPLDKWNGTAEELGASKPTSTNIKKVAKKLKIDVVIEGRIDKRRDQYIVNLKVRAGASGDEVGKGVQTTSEKPKLDRQSKSDLKEELIGQIGDVSVNRGGGDEDEDEDEDEDKPKKATKKPKVDDADEDEDADEDKPKKKGFSRKNEDEDEDDPLPKVTKKPKKPKKPKKADDDDEDEDEDKPKKKVAKSDDDDDDDDEPEDGIDEDADEVALGDTMSPGERAIDFAVGLSLNARRLSWSHEANLGDKPPPYKGVPVAGVTIDATVFPLAISHKQRGIAKDIGVTVLFDQVLKISSRTGNPPVELPTTQSRWAVGAAYRRTMGKLTVGGALRFGRQKFTIAAAGGVTPGIPNVNYTIIDPVGTLRFVAMPKLVLIANLGFMLVTNTGQIQRADQYGAATVLGFEGELGGDYLLTKNIFARASFRFETIGFKFKGGATMSNMRDSDMEQDVFGARDSYLGGAAAVGYLF